MAQSRGHVHTSPFVSFRSIFIGHYGLGLSHNQLSAINKSIQDSVSFHSMSMRRPFPLVNGFPPALRLHDRPRKLAFRWHLNAFPMYYRFRRTIGLQAYLDDLNLLKQQRPSNMERMKIRAALDVVDSIPEVNIFVRDH